MSHREFDDHHYSTPRRPRPLLKQKRWNLRILLFGCCIRTINFFQGVWIQSWLKLQIPKSFAPINCAQLLVLIFNTTIVGKISSFSPLLPQQQLFSFPLIIFAFAFYYLFTLIILAFLTLCIPHKYCIPERKTFTSICTNKIFGLSWK